jgi:hypothetical protein
MLGKHGKVRNLRVLWGGVKSPGGIEDCGGFEEISVEVASRILLRLLSDQPLKLSQGFQKTSIGLQATSTKLFLRRFSQSIPTVLQQFSRNFFSSRINRISSKFSGIVLQICESN